MRLLKWTFLTVCGAAAALISGLAIWVWSAHQEASRRLADHALYPALTADKPDQPVSRAEWLVLSASQARLVANADQLCPPPKDKSCAQQTIAIALSHQIYDRRSQKGTLRPALVQHFLIRKLAGDVAPETLAGVYLGTLFVGQEQQGVEAAAQALFGKAAAELTDDEALTLGVLARAPGLLRNPDRLAEYKIAIRQRLELHTQ